MCLDLWPSECLPSRRLGPDLDLPLIDLLGQLETKLAGQGAPIVGSFRPERAGDEVAAILAAEGLGCPNDLATWFGWHDGADGNSSTSTAFEFTQVNENDLGGGLSLWHVMPLDDALRVTRAHKDSVARSGGDWLPAKWLGLMVWESAGLWCDTEDDAVPLYLVDGHADMPTNPPRAQFESLRDFVRVVIRFLDAGLSVDFRGEVLDPDFDPLVTW